MSLTAYPTLRLKLTMPQALKLQFIPAVPGTNAAAAADRAQQAAQEAQVAANAAVAATANKVDKTGDVMTGFLTLNANPAADLHAATKQYVDAHVSSGTGNVSNSGTPVLDQLAQWTDATHIKGLTIGSTMSTAGGELNTTAGGGNVMAVNSPLAGQFAQWTSAVQIQGRTGTQATALLDVFTSALKGLAPLSGGGTANFLRADGTWAAPPGAAGGAPTTAEYITSTADATLSAERVLTDTTTITWDRTTAAQIKANHAAHTGDVTTTAGGVATTIANDAVTYAKMQNASAASVLIGRGSAAGAGDPQEITLGTNLAMSGTTLNATSAGGTATPVPPQGRLTLQTVTPVMTTTQAAKTAIFYTPYVGNQIPLYDGTSMVMTTFAELSVATTDTTKSPAAIGASKVNDWFVWSDSGTIRLGHGPDWTSDTTRSAGTALVMVNGVLLNNASISNACAAQRGTYVGTTRSNASSQLDWIYGTYSATTATAGWFGVWNCYNRCVVMSQLGITGITSYVYNTATWRSANADNGYRVSAVFGLAEDAILAIYTAAAAGGGSVTPHVGIGYDTTSAQSGGFGGATNAASVIGTFNTLSLGFHFWQAIERGNGATSSFYQDQPYARAGLQFAGWM